MRPRNMEQEAQVQKLIVVYYLLFIASVRHPYLLVKRVVFHNITVIFFQRTSEFHGSVNISFAGTDCTKKAMRYAGSAANLTYEFRLECFKIHV